MEFIEWQVSSPDALRARLSSGYQQPVPGRLRTWSPVGREAIRPVATTAGQDIYTLFQRGGAKIRRGWIWGPRMTATQQDHAGRTGPRGRTVRAPSSTRCARLRSGTMPDLKALGLSTTQHDAPDRHLASPSPAQAALSP